MAGKVDLSEMDAAAEVAKTELVENVETWTAKDICAWWGRNYMKAGHKRLGRVVKDLGKKLAEQKTDEVAEVAAG